MSKWGSLIRSRLKRKGKDMISPTGRECRGSDKWGSGHYLAPRGGKLHQGRDYKCVPGQKVVSPIHGQIVRIAKPYPKGIWSGVLIQGPRIAVKLFYLKPDSSLVGLMVGQGQVIGTAQDIAEKYPGMISHIHLEICSADPEVFIKML